MLNFAYETTIKKQGKAFTDHRRNDSCQMRAILSGVSSPTASDSDDDSSTTFNSIPGCTMTTCCTPPSNTVTPVLEPQFEKVVLNKRVWMNDPIDRSSNTTSKNRYTTQVITKCNQYSGEWLELSSYVCQQINQKNGPIKRCIDNWEYNLVKMERINIHVPTARQAIGYLDVEETVIRLRADYKHVLPELFTQLTLPTNHKTLNGVGQRVVSKDSVEWQLIESQLKQNSFQPNIVQIVAHINSYQAYVYELTKQRMALDNNGHANELLLFHGTQSVDPIKIIQSGGLDVRQANMFSWFGRGVYMSANASFVHKYKHQKYTCNQTPTNVILLVKALVGKYKRYEVGERDNCLTRAPEGYDSVYAFTTEQNVSMYVVYNNNQLYTSYSIEYTI